MFSSSETPGLTTVVTIVVGHIALGDIIGFQVATALGFEELTLGFDLLGFSIGKLVADKVNQI